MEILKHISENDYKFQSQPNGCHSCWITVENSSVYLIETDESIVVDIFALGCEMEDPLASTYVFFDEANDIQEQNIEINGNEPK